MARQRPRVAIPLTYGLSVRYLLSTGLLELLLEVCDPVIGVGWDDPELTAHIEAIGATAIRLPDAVMDHDFRRVQRMLDVSFERRLASPTTAISRRWRRGAQPPATQATTLARQCRDRMATLVPGAEQRNIAHERTVVEHQTNLPEFVGWLEHHHIDAVVSLTPYHAPDQLMLWAAARLGLRSVTSVISFDNPTTRSRMAVLADRILVWNDRNRREIERSHLAVRPGQITIIGAPQFDLHRDPSRILDVARWRRELGLPPDRPVLLYGAGPALLLPGEAALVTALDASIGAGRIPGNPVILLRGHPADPITRWQALSGLDNVVLSPGWGRADGGLAWPSDDEIDIQMSTFAHASVHLNICSSMSIDGAAFDRPVITPTFLPGATRAERRRLHALYRQEHWQAIAESGGVTAASTMARLEGAISRHLAHPDEARAGRARLVHELLTYDDGRSGARLVAALDQVLRSPKVGSGVQ